MTVNRSGDEIRDNDIDDCVVDVVVVVVVAPRISSRNYRIPSNCQRNFQRPVFLEGAMCSAEDEAQITPYRSVLFPLIGYEPESAR